MEENGEGEERRERDVHIIKRGRQTRREHTFSSNTFHLHIHLFKELHGQENIVDLVDAGLGILGPLWHLLSREQLQEVGEADTIREVLCYVFDLLIYVLQYSIHPCSKGLQEKLEVGW